MPMMPNENGMQPRPMGPGPGAPSPSPGAAGPGPRPPAGPQQAMPPQGGETPLSNVPRDQLEMLTMNLIQEVEQLRQMVGQGQQGPPQQQGAPGVGGTPPMGGGMAQPGPMQQRPMR